MATEDGTAPADEAGNATEPGATSPQQESNTTEPNTVQGSQNPPAKAAEEAPSPEDENKRRARHFEREADRLKREAAEREKEFERRLAAIEDQRRQDQLAAAIAQAKMQHGLTDDQADEVKELLGDKATAEQFTTRAERLVKAFGGAPPKQEEASRFSGARPATTSSSGSAQVNPDEVMKRAFRR